MWDIQEDPADLMIALIFDGDLFRCLKEHHRFGLQQRRGAEGVAKRRRPKRVESLDGVLRLFLHIGRTPWREKRTPVITDIGVGAKIIAIGIDAALVMDTDMMGEIGVFERGVTVDQTAYALLSDLIEVVRSARK